MRIAIAGGTGVVGAHAAEAARARGHDVVLLTRTHGVDLLTGNGLDASLSEADAVIDTANITTLSAGKSAEFFRAASGNLLAAAARAGVGHAVLLSIVGIDRIPYDYYVGKIAQEQVFERSPVPWTILRATQFHEFAGQMFQRARLGPLHIAPRARTQPIAAAEVGMRLVALAEGSAQGRATDLGGPREEDLADMIKAYARRIGHHGPVPAVSLPGAQMKGMRAGLALPGEGAVLGVQTFDEWLTEFAER